MKSWLKPYVKQYKKTMFASIVLGAAALMAAAGLLFTSGYLISKSSTRPENILLVYVPIVLVRAFGISRPVLNYLQQLTSHSFVLKMLSAMRVRLFKALEGQAYVLKERYGIGDLLGLLADDLEHLQNYYLKTIFPVVSAIVLYSGAVVALGFFHIGYAICIAILLGILVFVLPSISLKSNRQSMMRLKMLQQQLYEDVTDSVMGAYDWQLSGRTAEKMHQIEQNSKQYDVVEKMIQKRNHQHQLIFQFVAALSIVAMLFFVANATAANTFSNLWIAAFVLVMLPIVEAFFPINDAVSHLPSYQASFNRLEQVESEQQQLFTDTLPTGPMTVAFKNVSFQYDEQQVLSNINMTLQQGAHIALVGKSGAGKSTIGKLLLGAYRPTSGEVAINGVKTYEMTNQLSHIVGVLEQKPYLFDTTILNNIRLGNVEATDEEVIEAAKKAQLHEFIMSLPEGYHTRVGELGNRFSGGERQRIALARIILQDTPIVLLDEPTVGLDPMTERALIETLLEALKDKTVIWITHHLSLMPELDDIYFLQHGHIRTHGAHATLMQTDAYYQQLYTAENI